MKKNEYSQSICGIWSDDKHIHLCLEDDIGLRHNISQPFKPFLWTSSKVECDYCNIEKLHKPDSCNINTPLDAVLSFDSTTDLNNYFKNRDKSYPVEKIVSIENQFLAQNSARMFANMRFDNIKRLQLDIEVISSQGFPVATRKDDRIIAVGLSGVGGEKLILIEDFTDEAEAKLLKELQDEIIARDPDTIEGHNIFKFDLPYINTRCKKLKTPMQWGRFGGGANFRKSRLTIAERTFAYTRCDIAGRSIIDSLILVQLYDLSVREMTSYTLKASAIHFGISKAEDRTYIDGDKIADMFKEDRETFCAYLSDDLRETAGLCKRLLPTYVAQVQNFPVTLQECILRGTGMKVESVFLEKYLEAKAPLPLSEIGTFIEGGMSQSYEIGVFKNVLHYDVASLYPSLMIHINKCPKNDYLNIFLSELKTLKEYRLKYKKLAKEAINESEKSEYDARQKSFKILINSFYGYLGLSTAIFSDSSLASEITRMGRELLGELIELFKNNNCKVLEADTDGIYLSSSQYIDSPLTLVEKSKEVLPNGIELEFDGVFDAMLCYKAKNYALLEGDNITLRGSGFRNRATEPFLRKLTETMVKDMLLERKEDLIKDIENLKTEILSGNADINDLSKGEFISKSPSVYEADVKKTGKGRRASLEASLLMDIKPEVGDKVMYYMTYGDKPRSPDWQRARPTSKFDKEKSPYDPNYYIKKIDDWLDRFSDLSNITSTTKESAVQGELF